MDFYFSTGAVLGQHPGSHPCRCPDVPSAARVHLSLIANGQHIRKRPFGDHPPLLRIFNQNTEPLPQEVIGNLIKLLDGSSDFFIDLDGNIERNRLLVELLLNGVNAKCDAKPLVGRQIEDQLAMVVAGVEGGRVAVSPTLLHGELLHVDLLDGCDDELLDGLSGGGSGTLRHGCGGTNIALWI